VSDRAQIDTGEFQSSMHIVHRGFLRRRWIPEFASNDLQLRAVLIHAVVHYSFRPHNIPADVQLSLDHLVACANSRVLYHRARLSGLDQRVSNQLESHLRAVDAAGGYFQLIGAVAYRAWRLKWPWQDISAELGIKHSQVTQILRRLKRIAFELNFPTHAPGKKSSAATEEAVLELWHKGLTASQIQKQLHCDKFYHVIPVLKRHGVYSRRNPRGYAREDVYPRRGANARKASPEEIVELRKQGLTVCQIAAKSGAAWRTVSQVLERRGLYVRKRRGASHESHAVSA